MPVPEKTERNDDIVRRWRANETVKSIARRYSISAATAYRIILRSPRRIRRYKMEGCPFCGSDDISIFEDRATGHTHAECADCGATGPDTVSSEEARDLWNDRA